MDDSAKDFICKYGHYWIINGPNNIKMPLKIAFYQPVKIQMFRFC